ncbi:MAG: type IV secretion protein IcmS [Legionellales bacterium]|mgnify:CR=1 FL=1|nr:type IV secretion protein IcmS [Legionellales bacterium]|tara:strand:- start:431 stop:769 length:339 start_codon:yes stop_codon:yes gene_type:complete
MDVKDQCIALSRVMGIDYGMKGRDLTYEEVFMANGFLPAIVQRADKVSNLCFGYGIGAEFIDDPKGTCGKRVQFDDKTPNSVRMICIADVLCELVTMSLSSGRTMLDELLYD